MLGFESRELDWIITGLLKYFDILLFLLRKHHYQLTFYPETFLQTMLIERGKVSSPQASYLLQHKYPEIPYMEDVHKKTQLEVFQPDFYVFSDVVCLDVSQQLDYIVCKCTKGMLQLWSPFTDRLMWTRPVVVEKSYDIDSLLPSRCFNARWLNSWLEKRKG